MEKKKKSEIRKLFSASHLKEANIQEGPLNNKAQAFYFYNI